MVERRFTALIAASITLMALAVLWNVFMRHRVPAETRVTVSQPVAPDTTIQPAPPPQPTATPSTSQGVSLDTAGVSSMYALARSEVVPERTYPPHDGHDPHLRSQGSPPRGRRRARRGAP